MIESRFDKFTMAEIRKELWNRRNLSNVSVGETVLRLSLDRPNDLTTETISKMSRSSIYLESMSGTRFDKSNGYQVNHKGYSKGYVLFNTKGMSEDDIAVIIGTYSSMFELDDYINVYLKPFEIMELKSLIMSIKSKHLNDTVDTIYMLMHKLRIGEL